MNKKCFNSVRVLQDLSTGKQYAQAILCGSISCDYCRSKIIHTLKPKVLSAVKLYNLNQFFTLTSDKSYGDLIADFERARKKMHNMKKSNFIRRSRGKSFQEKEKKYELKVQEMVEYEILMMFYITYSYSIAKKIAKKEGISYHTLKSSHLNKSDYTSRKNFINTHLEEIENDVISLVNEFKAGTLNTPFVHEQRKFNRYEELYNYCFEKITKDEDSEFYYIRVLEISGGVHFHILCNKYINHYIMAELFSEKSKGNSRKLKLSNRIYLNKAFQTNPSLTNKVDAPKEITKYILKSIGKELAEGIENLKKTDPSISRIDFIKANKCINVAYKVKPDASKKGKFKPISFHYNVSPRVLWDEIDKSKGIDEYFRELETSNPIEENAYNILKKKRTEKYTSEKKNLENAKRQSRVNKNSLTKIVDQINALTVDFQNDICKIETSFLKHELDKKLDKTCIDTKISDSYLDILKLSTEQRHDLSEKEKLEYLENQSNFVKDLKNPQKKIVFLLGGAGSGKTSTIKSITECLEGDYKIEFAALSAKAANVLTKKGLPAKTIHRLCKSSYDNSFLANENNPLDIDILFVDEISLVSKYIFASLLNALKPHVKIICCGDSNQLNPIASNNLIYELNLLNHKNISFNYLNINFRSKQSICDNAEKILNNDFSDLNFKPFNIDEIHQKIIDGYQVITTSTSLMKYINMNENKYNAQVTDTITYSYSYGQEILILKNDYSNDIYNGSTCIFQGIRYGKVNKIMLEKLNGDIFEYPLDKSADCFQPAFAITIHKSQGSEYPKVAIVLDNKDKLLNNNLLYTAITRAQLNFEIYVVAGVNIDLLKEKQNNNDKYTMLDI